MYQVKLTMKDLFSEEVVERTIDGTNAMKNGSVSWELGNKEEQRESLNRWINERGNSQHETILELIDWELIKY